MSEERALMDEVILEGWEECGTCGGTGWADGGDLVRKVREARTGMRTAVVGAECPDCASGLVPPEGMVEAAAQAIVGAPVTLDDLHPTDRQAWVATARLALIAAARWGEG